MTGKTDKRRKFNKENEKKYRSNKFWNGPQKDIAIGSNQRKQDRA